jgi:hypothetical protein
MNISGALAGGVVEPSPACHHELRNDFADDCRSAVTLSRYD